MATVKKRTWKGANGKDRQAWRVDFTDFERRPETTPIL